MKKYEAYPYHGMLFINKNEQTTNINYTTGEPQKYHVSQRTVSAPWKAEAGGSLEPRSSNPVWATK